MNRLGVWACAFGLASVAGCASQPTPAQVPPVMDAETQDVVESLDADPTDVDPTDADPTDADPTDADPTDADPTDAGREETRPLDADPTDQSPDVSEAEPDVEPPPLPTGTWQPLAGSDGDLAPGISPGPWTSLVFTDTQDNPLVVFTEASDTAGDCVEAGTGVWWTRFDGDVWIAPERISPEPDGAPLYAFAPSVAVDKDGVVVAWTESHSCKAGKIGSGLGTTVKARRFSETTGWTDLGEGSTSNFGITGSLNNRAAVMRIDPQGRPVALYVSSKPGLATGGFVYVRRFAAGPDGVSSWKGLGPSGDGFGIGDEVLTDFLPTVLDLTFDAAGEPVAVWSRYPLFDILAGGSTAVLLKRWNGSEWVGQSGSGGTPGLAQNGSTDFFEVATTTTSGDTLHVVWTTVFLAQAADPLPLYHVQTDEEGSWQPEWNEGSAGLLPDMRLTRPVLATGLGDRPILAATQHDPSAAVGAPNDAVVVFALDTKIPIPLGTAPPVPAAGTAIQRVALQATPAKLGLVWVSGDALRYATLQ